MERAKFDAVNNPAWHGMLQLPNRVPITSKQTQSAGHHTEELK
jgi:hypothetical protein